MPALDPISALIDYLRSVQQYLVQLQSGSAHGWPVPGYGLPDAPASTQAREQSPAPPSWRWNAPVEAPRRPEPQLTVDPFRQSLYRSTPGARGETARPGSAYWRGTDGAGRPRGREGEAETLPARSAGASARDDLDDEGRTYVPGRGPAFDFGRRYVPPPRAGGSQYELQQPSFAAPDPSSLVLSRSPQWSPNFGPLPAFPVPPVLGGLAPPPVFGGLAPPPTIAGPIAAPGSGANPYAAPPPVPRT
jgi:hypothetical protein